MGIPKFFRWLTRRYPMILQTVTALEDVPPIDNLYLDLNGIVHNCIHGNDPKRHERISKLGDLEELWASIMRAIDELVHVAKPKKVLFLAVDGVAPRAKMNQQRARRFKSAKEREMLTNQLRAQGKNVPDMFDTNAISPGTEFMVNLCTQLHFFIQYKVSTDPLYQGLKECIISDGHVPGEGEHKMLDYIRKARTKPDYDPNTRHCFYGADADLIMLSLLTHEPHFTIIREEHVVKKQVNGGVQRVDLTMTNQFQLIHISLLREYFKLEYRELAGKLRMPWNLERIIDDFIFFCFFIGNDFLPNISALDIGEGSLDKLIDLYKLILPNLDDYITFQGVINWERAEKLIWVLGEHEDEVFKDRIDSSGHKKTDFRTISIMQDVNPLAADPHNRGQRTLNTFNLFKEKIYQKKVVKATKMKAKGDGKKYKKFLITKMFREDAENKVMIPKEVKDGLKEKFTALFVRNKPISVEEESKQKQPMHEVVQEIDEEYFSDLRPEDIPDDCVSDVGENVNDHALESIEESAEQVQENSITNAAAEMVRVAEEANLRFMNDFVRLYAQDPNAAKAEYYKQKVHIDITQTEGQSQRARMCKKYLEGIQWVLFYYYRGAQHWRWYYPFHYAPLIGDFGVNLVKDFLAGNPRISTFEIDSNCPEETEPYTPFQQLLAILPIRSMRLLPDCYRNIATNDLKDFFPDDFSVDLNGKTLAWEAIVLIPFVDQALFLETEAEMLQGNTCFSQVETDRNKWKFCYHNYMYQPSERKEPLKSTLTNLVSVGFNHTKKEINEEYQHVGEEPFAPVILKGCVQPCVGYPSFAHLNIQDITYETIVVRKVQFKKLLVKIPQCIEETQPEILEAYLWKLAKQSNKQVFIDLPYQRESFPMFFEDAFSVYTLFGDPNSNQFTIQHAQQWRSPNEWEGLMKRVRYRLTERGIDCPIETTNVLVTCNKVQSVKFSGEYENHQFYKMYDEKADILPLSLLVRRRDQSHYLNVDKRVNSLQNDLNQGQPVIFLKTNLFGVMGKIDFIDMRKQLVKLLIDKQAEESKVHDPFLGQKHLQMLQKSGSKEIQDAKAYFGEVDVDMMLGVKAGITARITSSFMLTYKDPKTKEKCMVDIGLNLKNWTKQMHVAGYVRFVQTGDKVAVNQFDGFEHNTHAHGAKHVKFHWEFSKGTVELIAEYREKFPLVFDFLGKCLNRKKDMNMPQLKDLFGNNEQAVGKLKEVLMWIDSLPVSHLPFVDMGFDALTPEMIQSLNAYRETVQNDYQSCNLVQKPVDWAKASQIFVEKFPYWSSPFPEADLQKYQVGDRVININSTLRSYVPFGLRGTVVGKTQKQVLVCFDQQFLQGTDLNGHCDMYRGQTMDPNNLINVTRKFKKQRQENAEIINKFTEVDPKNAQPQEQVVDKPHPQPKPKPNHQAQQKVQQASVPQKQASTGYAQTAVYKQKSYQPVQTAYQPKQQWQSKQPQEEAKIEVMFAQQPTSVAPEKPILFEDPAIVAFQPTTAVVEKPVLFEDPAIVAFQPTTGVVEKPVLFEDPAIVAFQPTNMSNVEESKAAIAGGLPQLQFAPIANDLKPSVEFQKLLADLNGQPQTIQDMLNVLGSLQGPPQDASSKSQAMIHLSSSPFIPSEQPSDKGVNPE